MAFHAYSTTKLDRDDEQLCHEPYSLYKYFSIMHYCKRKRCRFHMIDYGMRSVVCVQKMTKHVAHSCDRRRLSAALVLHVKQRKSNNVTN
jgi:hypothetical protein